MDPEIVTEISQRAAGPFSLRLLLQPCLALIFAIRDGRSDAAAGNPPYLQRLAFHKGDRRETLATAWGSVGKVLIMALVLDCAFQFATARSVSLWEAVGMAILLCAVPYTLMRGPAARLAKRTR